MAINHGLLSEKGNGKDQAKSIPKPIRELFIGGSTKWPSSTTHSSPALKPGEVNYTGACEGVGEDGKADGKGDQRKHVLLSAGRFFASLLWRRVLLD